MLSILEKQLLDLKKQNKLKDLIKEIPKIEKMLGMFHLLHHHHKLSALKP